MRPHRALAILGFGVWAVAQAQRVDFVNEIQPLFRVACYPCHGPKTQMAQLRLDSKALAFGGGISGKILIPGSGSDSLLVQRISGGGGKVRMPLQGTPLTPEQVDRVRRWIDEGANWPEDATIADAKIARHWSYAKPVRPPLPVVKNAAWARHPIDRFVLSRLEREGLPPAAEASRETLIRRVSLDLIGLPPSLEEVNDFVADPSPHAYEKIVDRLLASPHYGEKWARPWLDLARYADTNGFADNRRIIWKYRDWVIDALNRDLPFDQFSIEQIAGDMLPDATLDQRIATGFHRNTMFNDEGGVDQDEARWINNVDRAATTATIWLGSTLGCAQCHNHKYDPFTQKDFYRLLAFFETADYHTEGEGRHQLFIEPVLELPTREQATERKRLREEIARWGTVVKTSTPELEQAQSEWERAEAPRQALWRPLQPVEFRCTSGASIQKRDDTLLVLTPNQDKEDCTVIVRTRLKPMAALQLELFPPAASGFELAALRLEAGTDGAEQANVANLATIALTLARRNHTATACRFRLSAAAAPGTPLAPSMPDAIRLILETGSRTKQQADELAAYYRSIAPLIQPARDRVAQLSAQLAKLPIVTTLVMRERQTAEKRSTHLRIRGSYLNKGELVEAGLPGIFQTSAGPYSGRPARPRALAGERAESPRRTSCRKPILGGDFRPRDRGNHRRLRDSRRSSQPSGAARLACSGVYEQGMEHEIAASPDRHLRDLPAKVGSHPGAS